MENLLSFTLISCMLLSGCTGTRAPFYSSGIGALYAVNNPKAPQEPGSTDLVGTVSTSRAELLAIDAASYGKSVDDSSKFKVDNDLVAMGLLTTAGIGLLTNAHSDLYKSTGALLGLSFGLDTYLSPKEQSAIYLKAAEAASCSARRLNKLASLTSRVSFSDVQKLLLAQPVNERGAKSILYSLDVQTTLKALNNPFLSAKIIEAGLTAETNRKATEDALNFLNDIGEISFARQKEIILFKDAAINKIAFDRDKALKKISQLSVTPSELLKSFDEAELTNSANISPFTAPDPTTGEGQLNSNLRAIIDTINDFQKCNTQLTTTPES